MGKRLWFQQLDCKPLSATQRGFLPFDTTEGQTYCFGPDSKVTGQQLSVLAFPSLRGSELS